MLLLSQLQFSCLFGLALSAPWDPEPKPDQWWIDRHNGFVQNTIDNANSTNVIFYGDSITEGWKRIGIETYNLYYEPLGTANYGIAADQTQHVLWRIINGEIVGLNPKLCVLKIGTNNLGLGNNSDEDTATGIRVIVERLKADLPSMKILLLGILPRNDAEMTARVDNINRLIAPLDNGDTIRFLNMRDTFYLGNGQFPVKLFNSDLIHLSPAGYAKWAEVMNPLFAQMLDL